ncbi:MAG: hypothetical protein ABL993_14635 [Vicinamibacterales bacterium]
MRGIRSENIRLAVLAPVLLGVAAVITGRIEVGGGAGWDGRLYVSLLQGRLDEATHNILMRPAVILLNLPAYVALGNPIAAFAAMNYVYAFALAFAVCALYDRYCTDPTGKRWLVVNLFLCISVARMFAFYPTLIDLGACAVLTLATLAVLRGPRWLQLIACSAAVLTREFGIGLPIFGFIREVRMTRRVGPALLTYAPAVALFAGMRWVVSRQMPGLIQDDAQILVRQLDNLRNPVFVLLFAYFLLTVFGGVSLAVVVAGRRAWALVRREIEWAAFLVVVIPVTLLTHDIWRYLMFLAPVVVVLFATGWEATPPVRRRAFGIALTVATILTQRPWDFVNEFVYFRDWFPFYGELGLLPSDVAVDLWPLWAWRLVFVAGATWALAEVAAVGERATNVHAVGSRGGAVWAAFAIALGSVVVEWPPYPAVLQGCLVALALGLVGWQLTRSGWGVAAGVAFAWLIDPAPRAWPALAVTAAGLALVPWYLERPAPARAAAFAAFTLLATAASPLVGVIFGVTLLVLALTRERPRSWAAALTIVLVAAIVTMGIWRGLAEGHERSVWRSGDVLAVNPPSVAPRFVNVRWSPAVDAVTRAELERRYGMEPSRPEGDRTWHYRLGATSRVADILADPRVEDTAYFERLDSRWRLSRLLGAATLSRLEPGPGVDLAALARVALRAQVWLIPLGIAILATVIRVESGQAAFLMAMAIVAAVGAATLGNIGDRFSWAAPTALAALTGVAAGFSVARQGATWRHLAIRAALSALFLVNAWFAALAGQFADKVR